MTENAKNAVKEIRTLLNMKDINLKQVTITPKTAQQLLQYNTNNRARQKVREKEYAQDMREGKFGLQESMISFDENGVLTNGQTRLYACIDAQCNFDATIFIGLNQNLHMDTGKSRTTVDNIRLSKALDGIINDNPFSIQSVKTLLRVSQHINRVRDEEVVKFCKEHADKIDEAYEYGLLNLSGKRKYVFRSEIAAAFLAACINDVDINDLIHIRAILTDGRSVDEKDIIIQNYRDKIINFSGNSTYLVKKQAYLGAQHVIYCYTNRKRNRAILVDREYYPIL